MVKSTLKQQAKKINWDKIQLVKHKGSGGIILTTEEGNETHNKGEFAGVVVYGTVSSEDVGRYFEDWDKEEFELATLDVVVSLTNNK